MNGMQWLHAMGDIEDAYILEADWETAQPQPRRKVLWISMSAAAAGLCLLAASLAWWGGRAGQRWPIKELPPDSASSTITQEWPDSASSTITQEWAILRPWEELSISEQYTTLHWEQATYDTAAKPVPHAELGPYLTTQTLSGWDPITDEEHSIRGEVYRVAGISPACAVAVRLGDGEEYYLYRNSGYRPDTLGQMIDDLSLEENLVTGSVWYTYQKPDGAMATVEFVDLPTQTVWEMLLSDRNASNVENFDSMFFHAIMGISISIPVLGYENISLSVTQEGYLTTNILDTGKAFYLGQDTIQSFVTQVIEHCEGYEIVHGGDTRDDAIPETDAGNTAASQAVASHTGVKP